MIEGAWALIFFLGALAAFLSIPLGLWLGMRLNRRLVDQSKVVSRRPTMEEFQAMDRRCGDCGGRIKMTRRQSLSHDTLLDVFCEDCGNIFGITMDEVSR